MNAYEAKQAARKERYEQLAEKNRTKADQEFRKGDLREEVSGIPMGQPVLVGHHSERRHRNALERADNAMRRGVEATQKAQHYDDKADSVGRGGISSDDPTAIAQLKEQLEKREAQQALMKAANKLVRKNDVAGLAELLGGEAAAIRCMEPDFCGRRGFADFELTNNNANIRRIKQRIEQLTRDADREPAPDVVGNWYRLVENVEENRVQLFFDGKPSADIRTRLKRAGFRWSPSNGAWQRHLNNAGRYAAQRFIETNSPEG